MQEDVATSLPAATIRKQRAMMLVCKFPRTSVPGKAPLTFREGLLPSISNTEIILHKWA